MKNNLKTLLALSAAPVLALSSQAATITWDDEAGNDNWSSGTNWDGAQVAPANGDSVILTATSQSRLDYAWTIQNGQSLTTTATGLGDELVLQSDSILTLATGGTMDIGFMRPRFSSGGQFIIEPGATLMTGNYGLGSISSTITFEADASGVTTWSNAGQFQLGSDNLIIDLSNYDIANGDSIVLIDHVSAADLSGQTFANITVLNGGTTLVDGVDYNFDYAFDQGGGDVAIALTNIAIPEPSTAALLGLSGLALLIRRRK